MLDFLICLSCVQIPDLVSNEQLFKNKNKIININFFIKNLYLIFFVLQFLDLDLHFLLEVFD